jgi:hypothetical protein
MPVIDGNLPTYFQFQGDSSVERKYYEGFGLLKRRMKLMCLGPWSYVLSMVAV